MSFYSDASLVMIPSGYKTSKVYCAKPTDGSGDLVFSRSNDTATRVASNGLIEKVRTNLALYSEQFDNAVYTKSQASVTANATTAPNGTTTADKLVEDTSNDIHRILQDSLPYTSGTEMTLSVYAKPSGRNKIELRMFDFSSNFASVYFDISTGTILSTIAGVGTITDAGNGWYRCSVTAPASATSANGLGLVYLLNAGGADSYTGDGTSGAFLWGFQVERGVATDYIATTTAAVSVGPVANVPRLDYLNSSCPRLLLEPQRTNLVTYSEQLNNVWTTVNGTTTANFASSPDGTQNAEKAEFTSSGDSSFYQSVSGSSAAYSISIFAKYVSGGKYLYIFSPTNSESAQVWFDIEAGTVANQASGFTGAVQNYGNGWYRCTLTNTSNKTLNYMQFGISSTSSNRTLSASSVTYFYGAQVEAGAYATSYIPTLGASVTRGADVASKTGISSLIGQTEGVLFAEFSYNGSSTSGDYERIIGLGDGTTSDRIILIKNNTSSELYAFIGDNGSSIINQVISGTNILGTHKVAFAYKTNDFAVYLDGTLVYSSASGTVPATSNLYVGVNEITTTDFQLAGTISQALLFKTRLSNSELASLTA